MLHIISYYRNINQNPDTTSHLKWLKPKRQTITGVVKDGKKLNSSYIAGGITKTGAATLGNCIDAAP